MLELSGRAKEVVTGLRVDDGSHKKALLFRVMRDGEEVCVHVCVRVLYGV